MSTQPALTDAQRVVLLVQAQLEVAELIAGAVPPVGVPHSRPDVEVLVGEIEEARPPARPGGPFRVFLSPATLAGPVEDRRWSLAHELSHVCLGHEDPEVRRSTTRLVAVWAVLVAGVVAAGVVVLARLGYPLSLSNVSGPLLIAVGGGAVVAGARVSAQRTLRRERAADGYAAAVVGVAMTAAVRDRIAAHEATFRARTDRCLWTHPPVAERYLTTQQALAERLRPDGVTGSGDGAR